MRKTIDGLAQTPFLRTVTRICALIGFMTAAVCGDAMAADPTHIKVASPSKEIIDNLALYVALDRGFFKDENLTVEIVHFTGGGEVVRAITIGATEFGMIGTPAAIIAVGRGQPLKIISAWTAPAYGIVYVVPTNSPIKTVKDLAGKKVGMSRPGSVSQTGFVAAFEANGIQGQVEIVPVGGPGDSWAAIKAGRVQATWHTAPDVYSLVDRKEARILFQISDYLKDYQQGALAALDSYLTSNGETTRRFLRATAKAAAFIEQNPTETVEIGVKHMGSPRQSMRETLAAMPKGFFRIGAPEPKHYSGSLAEAKGTAAVKGELPPYDKIVDVRFLP